MRHLFYLLLITASLFISVHAGPLNSSSSDALDFCISEYREGYYGRAVECINNVLPSLTSFRDSVECYKMLALSYGMINQIDKAKEFFTIALQKDSAMDIDTLAFPPNIALIYNQVKLEKKISQIKDSSAPRPVPIKENKKITVPALLISSVILSTGGAVYLYYNGIIARKNYSNLGNDQVMLDKTWKEYTYSIAGGIGCTVISGIATWIFFREINRNTAVSIKGWGNGILVGFNF